MYKNKNSFFKVHSAVCCVSQSSLHLSNDRIRFYYSKTQLRQRKVTETHINVIVKAVRRICNGILRKVEKKKGKKNRIILVSGNFFPTKLPFKLSPFIRSRQTWSSFDRRQQSLAITSRTL